MFARAVNSPRAPRSPEWSRRDVLRLASAAVGLLGDGISGRAWAGTPKRKLPADDPDLLVPFERLHYPVLRLPVVSSNGAKVPIVVEMIHPMERGHYITSVEVVNQRDPVPSKGTFRFTPANGQVYLSFQARMHYGVSEVSVTAECNLHGRWSSTRSINIPEGAGGCAAAAPPPERVTDDELRPPVIRIPELVKSGHLRANEIILVQLVTRHPSRTGLLFRDGKFAQASEPFHLREIQVLYGEERVSRFELTSALSDDPFISFRLRARREGLLRMLVTNNRGQRFEATHQIRLS
jgi:desulfoferrodoxin (superoxide reductase-like protein)